MDTGPHRSKHEPVKMMKSIRPKNIGRLPIIAVAILCYIFLTAFTLPTPQQLTKSIELQLEKIREKAPKIKAYRKWRETEKATWQLLRKAELAGAPRYAKPDWIQALKLFSRAKDYAKKQSFKKATFLAKKAREQGALAMQKAREELKKRRSEARALLEPIDRDLDLIDKHMDHEDRSLITTYAQLLLEFSALENALKLEHFQEIREKAPALQKKVESFKRSIGVRE